MTEKTIEELAVQLGSVREQQETTALINIHRRLILRYGEDAGLAISRSGLGGLCVRIHIPLNRKGETEHVDQSTGSR